MKNLFVVFAFLVASIQIHASDWIKVKSDQPGSAEISLISSDINTSNIQFSLDGFWKSEVETSEGIAWKIRLGEGTPMLKKGAPELQKFATSIIIPGKSSMKVTIVSSEFEEFRNVLMLPSKGNLSRQVDPSTIDYEFGRVYKIDAFFPGDIAKLSNPYIVRDYRGQAITIQPFQYNPVTKTLRVYYNITLKVEENGSSNYNILNNDDKVTKVDSRFNQIYDRHFLNYGNSGERYTPVEEYGRMLIISYGDFIDEIQPLADWKIMTGTPTEIVDVADIGGATDIKQYVSDEYNNNGLTFVLLVGDAEQVPSSSVQGSDSDVDYAFIAGDDSYPDVFIGRFSAETEAHVNTMVNRTLSYEKEPLEDDTAWYSQAIGVASNEGPGDDGELDYEHIRNINENKLFPFTYDYSFEFFDGSQGGEDEAGSPTPSMIEAAVNSGASIINYTGHGSTTSWGTSGFSNNNVDNLTNNTGKWPFIFSVACVNGNFVGNTCFGEAWTRATYEGEPSGAIATLMSTINQSWNPPMCGQDEMNSILSELYEDNIKRTYGGIAMNGVMEMNDEYGNSGYNETNYWTIFGDPSLLIRTAAPAVMTVNAPESMMMGTTTLTFDCDANGGLAALTKDGIIYGTGMVEDGSVTITFEAIDEVAEFDLVVTAFNFKPFMSTIQTIASDAPFVVFAEYSINDMAGNNDGILDYSEEVLLTLALTNIGMEDAGEVIADINTDNPYVTLSTTGTNYGAIAAGDTVTETDAYDFSVAEDVPDGEEIQFTISAEDMSGRSVWESTFEITAHAPMLQFVNFSIDDSDGNANGRLDAGETANIMIDVMNDGSSAAYNVMAQLATDNDYLTIVTDPFNIGDLPGNEGTQLTFKVLAHGDAPDGVSVVFNFSLAADYNITATGDFFTNIGQKPVLLLNLTGKASMSDSITGCLNNLQVGVEQAQVIPANVEEFQSLFVILGVYPDNHVITAEEGAILANFLENGGRLYMEGGDTWSFDEQTSVHEMFNISGDEDGSGDIGTVLGEDNGFLQSYVFNYTGPNSYIDHVSPVNEAFMLMSNEDPAYGLAVAYENDIYKTIGASCSFSGFIDQQGSTKDGMMAEVLNFFEIGFIWTDVNEKLISESNVSAYPNPFDREVNIIVELKENAEVSIDVYDLTGRKISTLVDSKLKAGKHQFIWNATDQNGRAMEPGIYFYHVRSGEQAITKKLILTR